MNITDPQVQRILSDPEFQRAWAARQAAWQSGVKPEGYTSPFNNPLGKAVGDRFRSLGGLPDDWMLIPGPDGQPTLQQNQTSNLKALGKAGLYTGLAAGAAFGVPALAGALGGGAGAAGGAAAASGAIPVGAAGAVGAGTGGGMLGAFGGLLGGGSTLGKIINTGTDVAGQIAAGRANGRAIEARNANETNLANANRYRAALDAAQFDASRRPAFAREALSGAMLKSLQDAKVTAPEGIRMGSVSGGLRPSLLTNRAEIGDDLQRKATMALLSSDPVMGAPKMPDLVEQPESGFVDKLLTGASYVGTGLGTLRDSMPVKPTPGVDMSKYKPLGGTGTTFGPGPAPLTPQINLFGRKPKGPMDVNFNAGR